MVLEINTPSFIISLFSDGPKLSEFSHKHGETQELDGHTLNGALTGSFCISQEKDH